MTLLLFFIGVHVSATENKPLHPGPIGISLCKQMCFTTSHCEMFTYVPNRLACYLGNLTKNEDCVVSNLKTTILGNGSIKKCPSGSKIVVNRMKKLICFRENSNATLTSGNEFHVRELPRGYKKLNGSNKILKFYKIKKKADDAKKHCIQDGGSLAQFKKGFDWNLFKQIYVPTGDLDCSWIALFYDRKEDQYLWADGELFNDSDRWVKYEPSKGILFFEENCICFVSGYQFRDMLCSREQTFVCELNI